MIVERMMCCSPCLKRSLQSYGCFYCFFFSGFLMKKNLIHLFHWSHFPKSPSEFSHQVFYGLISEKMTPFSPMEEPAVTQTMGTVCVPAAGSAQYIGWAVGETHSGQGSAASGNGGGQSLHMTPAN